MTMNKDHEYCLRCGRKLKKPEARELGYGKTCYRKLMVSASNKLFKSDGNLHSSESGEELS